jgi:hypothetical protein
MHIYVYAILKCRELKKNKKTKNTVGSLSCVCARQRTIWSLCRAHTHGKEPTWHPPVHPGSWLGMLPRPLSCVLSRGHMAKPLGRRTAKDKHVKGLTHGNGLKDGKGYRRTAKDPATATAMTHGNVCTHGKVSRCTAKTATHDKGLCRA